MKRMNWLGNKVIVYEQEDLVKMAPLLTTAAELWEREGTHADRHQGTCVIGSGIAVLWLGPGKRNPESKVVVPCPFQSDGSGSVWVPLNFLVNHGISAYHEPGRMD